MRILGLSGNVKHPSRTASLVEALASAAERRFGGVKRIIELADAAAVLFRALRADQLDSEGREIIDAVETADVLIVGSPVYRASYTGALKHLFDLVDYRALTGRPVVLAATGGSALHALMIEHQLRPLFGFFNAFSVPTSVYAVEADFTDYRLTNPAVLERVDRAIADLARLLPSSPQRVPFFAGEDRPAPVAMKA
ncbi:FMN reductase [Sinorhizobium glycinis]|uniref:FMN reductase n=1 Tax=Sinorhizobium glycinis TaxID=1472378 RepID=A0A178XSL2_9HYPH|nr:FMN reductase [Sinorhizobium glycinis]OAP38259.1 FMN reductase [Sinorhizobium glycinis]